MKAGDKIHMKLIHSNTPAYMREEYYNEVEGYLLLTPRAGEIVVIERTDDHKDYRSQLRTSPLLDIEYGPDGLITFITRNSIYEVKLVAQTTLPA